MIEKLKEPETLILLPMAAYGLATGVFKYFIKAPVANAIQSWVDGHTMTQQELDDYILEHSNFEVDSLIGYTDTEGTNTHE